ncbi:hypothetical protein [Mycobacterium kansasii]|uniref:hypothetical protein n=1 Tax=Mycobacterium kansasii TaxID=1768 RepID=UPI002805D74A|nr:hypothetical protein [Mycobacterium kansasii]
MSDSWNFPDDPVRSQRIKKTVAQLIADPEAPFGRDPQGRAYTEQEYVQRFNRLSPPVIGG